MTITNGGNRDERHPNRGVSREQYEHDLQQALSEMQAAAGISGDAWPASAWSAGESRNRAHTYSKYTGSSDNEELSEESRTPPRIPAGIYGVKYSDSNDFEPEESSGYQLPPGTRKGGTHVYSNNTGPDRGPSDEEWEWDSLVNSLGREPGKVPPNIKPLGGRSEYYKYDERLYPKYED